MRDHQLSLGQFVKKPMRILWRHFPPLVTFRTRTAARETPAFRSDEIAIFITWTVGLFHKKTVLIRHKQSQGTVLKNRLPKKQKRGA